MKQIALYLILFSYSMVMLKPVSPYISDAVAHIFSYTQHMATVHYENGKMHVHKEIVNNAKQKETQNEIPLAKKTNTLTDHIITKQPETSAGLIKSRCFQLQTSAALHYNLLAAEYPPPRA